VTARAAFGWAVDNLRVPQNPFAGVKVRLAKRGTSREKGFSDEEAITVWRLLSNIVRNLLIFLIPEAYLKNYLK